MTTQTKIKIPTITIVFNNATLCSGYCSFCTAANNVNYAQGFDKNNTIKSLIDKDNRLYQMIKVDYDALEKAIVNYPGWKDSKKFGISVWGADPITSFQNYVDLYEFIEDLAKRYDKEVSFSGSTNGLAFLRDNVTEWFLGKNNIHMQISHDGWGNWMRALDIDTLTNDNILKLMRHGTINWISCVMNFYNASPLENIKYFKEVLPEDIYKNIQIRLYTVRDSYYDSNFINYNGFLDNKVFPELKGRKLGDLVIHNDQKLADETGIFKLAHQADTYFSEIEFIYRHIDREAYDPYRRTLIQRLAEYNKKMTIEGNPMSYKRPLCAQYHLGLSEYSCCIDTIGKYTDCHLYDSSQNVPNPGMIKPKRCNQCKYKDKWECNVCGAMELNPNYCQWNYRHNELMERLSESKWLMDWVHEYNKDRNINHKKIH
jgi:hypothetical protein